MNSIETLDMATLGDQNVVELTHGLHRNQIMKRIVGPLLTDIMQPIYSEEFSPEEVGSIPAARGVEAIQKNFVPAVAALLMERVDQTMEGGLGDDGKSRFKQFAELDYARGSELFFARGMPKKTLQEGVYGGVAVPLVVASHIYQLEGFDRRVDNFIPEIFTTIMEREIFDSILQHLTKGPNYFLEEQATDPDMFSSHLFKFCNPHPTNPTTTQDTEPLQIEDAYEVRDGEVVGLSDTYHLSASLRRNFLKRNNNWVPRGYKAMVSSGCPVGHEFERAGQKQEALIRIAKNFLIAALKVSFQKQVQSTTCNPEGAAA
jgi:hypothetical protein